MLLSQALDSRSDITDLHRQHPELAARLAELREALDRDPGISAAPAMPTDDAISTPLARPIERFGADWQRSCPQSSPASVPWTVLLPSGFRRRR